MANETAEKAKADVKKGVAEAEKTVLMLKLMQRLM